MGQTSRDLICLPEPFREKDKNEVEEIQEEKEGKSFQT